MKRFLLFFLLLALSGLQAQEKIPTSRSTVFFSIVSKDHAHLLPIFFECLENLHYDKNLVTLCVQTHDCEDATPQLFQDWIETNGHLYNKVIFKNSVTINSEGTTDLTNNTSLRNEALQQAQQSGCQFAFFTDPNVFLAPETLKTLVSENVPIIAPLLRAYPNYYNTFSNFFYAVDAGGYYQDCPEYYHILRGYLRGTFKVPVVHSTYLIQSDVLDKLSYSDGSHDYASIILARTARQGGVAQYICNKQYFGVIAMLNPPEGSTWSLEEQRRAYETLFYGKVCHAEMSARQFHEDMFGAAPILEGRMPRFDRRFITFKKAFELMELRGAKTIVETGTARSGLAGLESQGASTVFFADWAHQHNAKCHSVDIDAEAVKVASQAVSFHQGCCEVHCDDSVNFLSEFSEPIDFLYLDSYDFDSNDPYPSQIHHLKEIEVAYEKLSDDAIVLIDDCGLPHRGKGKLVIDFLLAKGWKILEDRYQVLMVR